MTVRAAAVIVFITVLAACGGGSPAPAGWQPVPGATSQWTTGTGNAQQRYSYEKRRFDGTLQTLASQEAVNAILRRRGARFLKSDVFAPCPGLAAIATFSLGKTRTLEEGLGVQNGQAIVVEYDHPNGAPMDPGVARAMQHALCVTSL